MKRPRDGGIRAVTELAPYFVGVRLASRKISTG
jgi:hypothetical protein